MRAVLLAASVLLAGASCQVILGIESTRPEGDPPADAAVIDGSGGDITDAPGQPDGAGCEPITLIAAKTYEPSSVWCDDERDYAPASVTFMLPGVLPVTDGEPDNHCAQLEYTWNGARTVCMYKGDFGSSYDLAECRTGDPIGFDTCGGDDDGDLVAIGPGDVVQAEQLVLHVLNGDPNRGRTQVTVTLEGSCSPDGAASVCEDFGDSGFAP